MPQRVLGKTGVSVSVLGSRLTDGPSDSVPAMGAIPTFKWVRGSTVLDRHRLDVPPDAPPGPVNAWLLVYDHYTQAVLPPLDERLTALGLSVPLDTRQVITVDSWQSTIPQRFVFVTCWGIWTANQDGSDVVSVVSQEELGYMLCPAGLSEDSERVAYWTDDGDQSGLWVSDIDSWNPHLVSDDWPSGFEPAGVRWTINPRLVFVVGYGEGQGSYTVDLDTGQRDGWNKLCPSVGVPPQTRQLAGWSTYHYSDDNPVADVIERDGSHWQFSGLLPSNLKNFECDTYAFPLLDWEGDSWCWPPKHDRIVISEYSQGLQWLATVRVPKDVPNPAQPFEV